jgi:hypothetical protein
MKTLACLLTVSLLSIGTSTLAEEPASKTKQAASSEPKTTAFPKVSVHKSPTCGCCSAWVEHMKRSGFDVTTTNVDNLGPIKERVGVPHGMGSCHTAEVGGYFIEGHVPAAEVKRFLSEKPKAKGLTVPRMPIGSPGMESGDQVDPYEVHLVHDDGTTSVYARYPKE